MFCLLLLVKQEDLWDHLEACWRMSTFLEVIYHMSDILQCNVINADMNLHQWIFAYWFQKLIQYLSNVSLLSSRKIAHSAVVSVCPWQNILSIVSIESPARVVSSLADWRSFCGQAWFSCRLDWTTGGSYTSFCSFGLVNLQRYLAVSYFEDLVSIWKRLPVWNSSWSFSFWWLSLCVSNNVESLWLLPCH